MFKFTDEIRIYCKDNSMSNGNISNNVTNAKFVPIKLNYKDFDEEIKELNGYNSSDEYVEYSRPVVLIVDVTDKQINQLLLPGVIHTTAKVGRDENGNSIVLDEVSEFRRVITSYDEIKEKNENYITGNTTLDSIVKMIPVDNTCSFVLMKYLGKGMHEGEIVKSFQELICYCPEVNVLTYIYKSVLDELKKSSIANDLLKNKKKTAPNSVPKLNIPTAPKINLDALKAVQVGNMNAPIVNISPAPVQAVQEDEPTDTVVNKDILSLVERVFKNYMEVIKKPFSVISSTGRTKPLTLQQVLTSGIDMVPNEQLSIVERFDIVNRNLTEEEKANPNNYRTAGNPRDLLPLYPKQAMEHILLGNYPFMMIYNKSIDDRSIVNDPMFNIKKYIIYYATHLLEEIKATSTDLLTEDDLYVIRGSQSIVNRMTVSTLYVKDVKDDKILFSNFDKAFDLCFIDASLMNIYFMLNKISYSGNLNQFINILSPVAI